MCGLCTDSWSADENYDVNSACKKKENWSSKRHEMSKWIFADALLWWFNDTLHSLCTVFHFITGIGLFQKKNKQGFDDIEFPGVLNKYIASGIPKG